MARSAGEANHRLQLRVTRADKARIARAAAIQQMDLTQFVTTAALREADAVIAQVDTVRVSMRYYRRILALLEDPPAPNTRLKEAWIYLAMSMLTLARVAKNSFQTPSRLRHDGAGGSCAAGYPRTCRAARPGVCVQQRGSRPSCQRTIAKMA